MFVARSISEEFSSGDAKYRDNDEPVQASHGRDPRYTKDKEDKERGDEGILFDRMILYLDVLRLCARARTIMCGIPQNKYARYQLTILDDIIDFNKRMTYF